MLLIALFKVPNTGALTVVEFMNCKYPENMYIKYVQGNLKV